MIVRMLSVSSASCAGSKWDRGFTRMLAELFGSHGLEVHMLLSSFLNWPVVVRLQTKGPRYRCARRFRFRWHTQEKCVSAAIGFRGGVQHFHHDQRLIAG